ncbi:MAG: hypothetical protein FWE15_29995 [Actinomycetia bacterium]|nr:hypothetical protein [Actinomycetes bacterium]
MARAAAAPKRTRARPGREPRKARPAGDEGHLSLEHYTRKPVTPAMEEYFDWIADTTGYGPDEGLDLRSVALAGTLRSTFQKEMRLRGSPRAHGAGHIRPGGDGPAPQPEPPRAAPGGRRSARPSQQAADAPY